MKRSEGRILTSHAGSLPRPPDLQSLNQQKQSGQTIDEAERTRLVRASVPDVVQRQIDCGVDIVGDGEYGKTNFLNYIRERLGGFEPTGDVEFSGAMADRLPARLPAVLPGRVVRAWRRWPAAARLHGSGDLYGDGTVASRPG